MVRQTEERDGWKSFVHAKSITVGKGRILYADACAVPDSKGVMHSAGWVLPGGRRTQDEQEALAYAQYINTAWEKHHGELQRPL